jgi:hypothetical protein
MNRSRVVIKRPLIHYFISLGYILASIVNILLLVFIARLGLSDILDRLFQGYGTLAGIWLLTAPIVGIGLYFVHRVSWYIFLGHSSLILIDYVLKWVRIPGYYWLSVRGVHQILLFTGNLALVVVIGYIIQKDFRAPYFQVLPRGWRTSRRVPIRHYIDVDGARASITDLSVSGCFVSEPEMKIDVGEKVRIRFEADLLQVECRGEVMRRTPTGYGIRFLGLSTREKRDIRRMITKRFPFRYKVDLPGRWISDNRKIEVRILDISNTGAYLKADIAGVEEGQGGRLDLTVHRRRVRLPATVIWLNKSALHDKPVGLGVQFNRNEKRIVSKIVEQQKKNHPAA